MRFLANENIPLASIRQLRNAGHDVAAVMEDAPGTTDVQVLARAHEESRILLTFDRDYGQLIYQRGLPLPAGVVYLRFDPQNPAEPATYILSLLAIQHLQLEGRFSVATRQRIRQRLLPATEVD
jgi:predicted nuclease of predicted toxin-antitoxin system